LSVIIFLKGLYKNGKSFLLDLKSIKKKHKLKSKVLIITYYWPPAGGPGVQRWLKFVKYLPDFE
jgi:hypothetical protein